MLFSIDICARRNCDVGAYSTLHVVLCQRKHIEFSPVLGAFVIMSFGG